MPTLSMFFGIIIKMYSETGGKHHVPHIHAEFQGDKITVSLEGDILEGEIPNKKLRLLLAWIEIHQEELVANWNLLQEGQEYFKIDPLK